jgi:ribosome-associated protein
VDGVAVPPKPRKRTRPTRSSQLKRLDTKAERSNVKVQRKRVSDHD